MWCVCSVKITIKKLIKGMAQCNTPGCHHPIGLIYIWLVVSVIFFMFHSLHYSKQDTSGIPIWICYFDCAQTNKGISTLWSSISELNRLVFMVFMYPFLWLPVERGWCKNKNSHIWVQAHLADNGTQRTPTCTVTQLWSNFSSCFALIMCVAL